MTSKITPKALRELITRAGITQARAATLCHASTRTMEQWLAGDRAMPKSATALLVWSLYWMGLVNADQVSPWIHPEVYLAAFEHCD
jgi:transcriptional regulator with XRE-family HTH domain